MQNLGILTINELKPGMIITNDVYKNGNLLIKKDTTLDEEKISILKRSYFFDKITVGIPDEILKSYSKEEEIKKVEQTFDDISNNLTKMFEQMKHTNNLTVNNELRNFANKILKELESQEIVVSSVLFKGSGNDCIYRHGVNVAVMSALIAKWLGFDKAKINLLIYSALLHDFGMTKLDYELQKKPDMILEKRHKEIKEHTKLGYESVINIPYLDKSVSYGVLMHHEREDGSGYFAIKGEKIHPFAKIIAIADKLDVLNSDIEGITKKSAFETLEEIKQSSVNKFDYIYTKVFLEHIANFYMGESVILSNNKQGKIIQINPEQISKPLLLVDDDFIDLSKNKDLSIKELVIH